MLRNITRRDCLQRITGVKPEKFQKIGQPAQSHMESDSEAQTCCGTSVWDRRLARTFAVAADLLSDVHDIFVFGVDFPRG